MMWPKFLKTNAPFVWPYALLLATTGILQILHRQGIIALWVNRHYAAWADTFFYYATYLGDGRFCAAVGLVVLFWQRRHGLVVLGAFAVSGLVSQLLKTQLFANEPRPAQYFAKTLGYLHQVPGVELHHWHSFPSGHTTSAFALWALVAFWSKQWWLKVLCLAVAVAVGYSRMYLFQHFLVDVWAGSLLGTAVAVGFYQQFSEKK